MANNPIARKQGFNAGIKAAIAWLHERADDMNDPHAKGILNGAAYGLGIDKLSITDMLAPRGDDAALPKEDK